MALALIRLLLPWRQSKPHHFSLNPTKTPFLSRLRQCQTFASLPKTLILTQDERSFSGEREATLGSGSDTIAAIVTSLGGGPAAVGIVRLSGPTAIAVAGRVFRPVKRLKEEGGIVAWRPRSHFVEYGYVLDKDGNVIDEVIHSENCLFIKETNRYNNIYV